MAENRKRPKDLSTNLLLLYVTDVFLNVAMPTKWISIQWILFPSDIYYNIGNNVPLGKEQHVDKIK